ncbi:hypothetical protein MKZ02_19590 [Pseudobacillus sp. FSL P4-0506]|uniref:hypothetical protein n=1 Tax=Pseudobacillus sp. FSL P4-0506 TaxID=2921576 RepID=UPI0030F560CF
MDLNEKIQFWKTEIERAEEYGFFFDTQSMKEVVNTVEQQQVEIEKLKRQFEWSMSGSAISLEKSVEHAREWFANQTELAEEIHELKKQVERYEQFIRACQYAGEGGLPTLRKHANQLLRGDLREVDLSQILR